MVRKCPDNFSVHRIEVRFAVKANSLKFPTIAIFGTDDRILHTFDVKPSTMVFANTGKVDFPTAVRWNCFYRLHSLFFRFSFQKPGVLLRNLPPISFTVVTVLLVLTLSSPLTLLWLFLIPLLLFVLF